jgi:hypothetical protein
MAIRSILNCFAIVTAIARPRALNDPVGSRPSSFTRRLEAPSRAAVIGKATIGVSGSPKLTGAPSFGSSSRHFHIPGAREAMLSRVIDRRAESMSYRTISGLPALLRLWTRPAS